MPKAYEHWTVLPHGPIEKLASNLWRVIGDLPGMSLKRNMIVARRKDGGLVIHNAIALDEGEMRELEDFGTPAYLVVPNGGHRLDAKVYQKRYPALRVVAPRGHRAKVEEVVHVDLAYEDYAGTTGTPPDDSIQLEMLRGVGDAEGAMIVHSEDGTTVVLNDAMFNMQRKRDPLGFLFTTVLGSAPGPRVSRLAKLLYVKDKKALRTDFERLAAIPDLVRVCVAHEDVASGPGARAALAQAATYL